MLAQTIVTLLRQQGARHRRSRLQCWGMQGKRTPGVVIKGADAGVRAISNASMLPTRAPTATLGRKPHREKHRTPQSTTDRRRGSPHGPKTPLPAPRERGGCQLGGGPECVLVLAFAFRS